MLFAGKKSSIEYDVKGKERVGRPVKRRKVISLCFSLWASSEPIFRRVVKGDRTVADIKGKKLREPFCWGKGGEKKGLGQKPSLHG